MQSNLYMPFTPPRPQGLQNGKRFQQNINASKMPLASQKYSGYNSGMNIQKQNFGLYTPETTPEQHLNTFMRKVPHFDPEPQSRFDGSIGNATYAQHIRDIPQIPTRFTRFNDNSYLSPASNMNRFTPEYSTMRSRLSAGPNVMTSPPDVQNNLQTAKLRWQSAQRTVELLEEQHQNILQKLYETGTCFHWYQGDPVMQDYLFNEFRCLKENLLDITYRTYAARAFATEQQQIYNACEHMFVKKDGLHYGKQVNFMKLFQECEPDRHGHSITFDSTQTTLPPTDVFVTVPGQLPINLSSGAVQTESRGVFIGNLPFDTRWDQLKSHFERIGKVKRCHLPMVSLQDSTINGVRKSRGFATVQYENATDAKKACQIFNGTKFCGRQIRVRLDRQTVVKHF